MHVSVTEFRANVGKYLDLATSEDIVIMKHGKAYATLSSSKETKQKMIHSLKGIGSPDLTSDKVFDERRKDYESLD